MKREKEKKYYIYIPVKFLDSMAMLSVTVIIVRNGIGDPTSNTNCVFHLALITLEKTKKNSVAEDQSL